MSARSLLRLALPGVLAGCATTAQEQDWRDGWKREPFPALTELATEGRQVNAGVGLRSFQDPGFGRLDDQLALTLDYCEPMGLGALRLEGGLHYSYDEADGNSGGQDVRLKGQDLELSVGLNYSLPLARLRPYAGCGVAFQFLNLRGVDQGAGTVFDDDDAAIGGYLKGGLLLQITRTSHVGLELRHLEGGDVSLDGTDLATDYDQVVIVFGNSFP